MQKFVNDYMEGAHSSILEKLLETNMMKTSGYGKDEFCASAQEKIRAAIEKPDAKVYFLCGGTQTNKVVIASLLRPFEAVISAKTGHIAVHEAGAIENSGHKVLEFEGAKGKLLPEEVRGCAEEYRRDQNKEHMVRPAMVYISQPTEFGTLYSKAELEELSGVCRQYGLLLFIDGARLGYALACEENDAKLADLARLADVFYIGGTKCGALLGEALVFCDPALARDFFSLMKQEIGVLAKGRILGIQFDTLFTDNLYLEICKNAIDTAMQIKEELKRKSYRFFVDSPTNQQFVLIDNDKMEALAKKVEFGYIMSWGEEQSVIRFCTSWATKQEDVEELKKLL
ncbi:MAG: aminotransferase class V-fold PLP-dependent enzyme [Johnsonella sp.]|nr:aminotransferase class V-fold PLP-dependent enzyme [Johnsonella sp.]